MSKPVISVNNLSKYYRIGIHQKRKDTIMGQLLQTLKKPIDNFRRIRDLGNFSKNDESIFTALSGINFDVKQGEVLGIIGHNGAGKSTLLKILSRITEPTQGAIDIYGRVSALLEVGTGFHQDLTGRDNIYMNGTILGMTRKEIDKKFDEIVDFSGIEKHIDTPVKFYSSGMKVRLGFAVAANLEPEILIIDEVLAVGDVEFQKKCLGKMHHVAESEGRTILFVSHHMPSVKNLCSRCINLNHGKIIYDGNVSDGIDLYLSNGLNMFETGIIPLDMRRDYGNGEVRFTQIALLNANNVKHKEFYYGEPVKIKINLSVFELIPDYTISASIGTLDGQRILFNEVKSSDASKFGLPETISPGDYQIELDINTTLLPGSYSVYLGFARLNGHTLEWVERVYDFQVNKTGYIKGEHYPWDESFGYVLNKTEWKLIEA